MPSRARTRLARATPVSEIMNRPLITIQLGEKAGLADQLMKHYAVHHLPVLEGKVLRGILSQRDLYKNMLSYFFIESDREQQDFLDEFLDIASMMTEDPVTVEPEQTVGEALELMLKHRIGSLPVVNRQNELVGIVTDFDLLRALAEWLE